MGFRTVAIGSGSDKAKLATELGTHVYIDSAAQDAAAALQQLGGAKVILATAPSNRSMGPLAAGLKKRSRLIIVGAPLEPIEVNALPLIFGGRSIEGSLTGSAIDGQDTLSFSVLEDVRPMIETMPLEKAADAFARVMSGEVRFRMVLTTGH
jgi:D-arabinose 1-dehydrogenase-like Zn-dependent alcohol dehydrogenase